MVVVVAVVRVMVMAVGIVMVMVAWMYWCLFFARSLVILLLLQIPCVLLVG